MRRVIRQILSEEIENLKMIKFLDNVVLFLLDDLYVKEGFDGIVSFGSVGEMDDLNIFNSERDTIINDENEFRKLGWEFVYDENDEDDSYYYRVDQPQYTYSYYDFSDQVIYDWLDSLVESNQLSYDENLGDHGEWVVNNPDLILKSKSNLFSCGLWRNELYKSYEIYNCGNTTNRVVIMRELDRIFDIESTEQMDYVLNKFFKLLPEKIESMGVKVKKDSLWNSDNSLNEGVIDDFIEFGKDELSLSDDFKVNLVNNRNNMETLGNYDIQNKEINVLSKNRALPDIIRSIAHEMVHHRQNSNGDLRGTEEEGEDGSPWEDEANAKAGEMVRKFGVDNPEIYDL
jgi:hypothetical protein